MVETSILTPEILGIVTVIISFVIGILAKQPAFQKAKSRISHAREFITQIDDALYDNKVTEEEFRKIFDAGKKLVDKNNTDW